jgi:hypothetical protein
MQATSPATARRWPRALAALLACALGITVVTAAARASHRDRAGHQLSVVAKTADVSQVAPRTPDLHGVLADAAIAHPSGPGVGPSETAPTANSRTAVTCSARGPPAQAAE